MSDAESYYQTFVVTAVTDSIAGTLYGSPIERSRMNTEWDDVYFAFVMSVGSGPYVHTARFDGERVAGTTYSPSRNFLPPWRADRVEE